jgi:hypothetical protein
MLELCIGQQEDEIFCVVIQRSVMFTSYWRIGELYEYLQTIVYFVINSFVVLLD